jgi:HECT-domain (ubiquitin-transferase)
MEFQQRMKIQSAMGDDAAERPDLYLPKAHTCFFSINLPRYSTKKVHNSV